MHLIAYRELFPRTHLTGEGGNSGMSVLLAAMQHASACRSWHLLMLLDSHLWILFGSDSSLENYFLDSWLKHGPILLLQASVVSHHLWTVLLLSSSCRLTGEGFCLAPPTPLFTSLFPGPAPRRAAPRHRASGILWTTWLTVTWITWDKYRLWISQFIWSWYIDVHDLKASQIILKYI